MVDVDTIGAGGGSIAYVDPGGIFRVGPRSAGAEPGPAAYGRGGTEPTATDAHRQPRLALAGGLPRRRHAAPRRPRAARRSRTARRAALGMSVEEASMGAVQILTHSMVQSIEENSVRKGYDPRDFALVAEGGAGPALRRADRARGRDAVGARAELPGRHRGARAARDGHGLRVRLDGLPARLEPRRRSARSSPSRSSRRRRQRSSRRTASRAERMLIQRDRRLPLPRPGLRAAGRRRRRATSTPPGSAKVRGRLRRHPRARVLAPLRGLRRRDPERPRARDRADAAARDARGRARASESPADALRHEGEAWFPVDGTLEQVATRYYDRAALRAGNRLEGPAIVNQYDSTTVDPARASTASIDRFGQHRDRVGRLGAAAADRSPARRGGEGT